MLDNLIYYIAHLIFLDTRSTMIETGGSYLHRSSEEQTLSTRSKSEADAIEERLEKYDWDYTRDDYYIDDEWDSAIFSMEYDAMRRPRTWIATRHIDNKN